MRYEIRYNSRVFHFSTWQHARKCLLALPGSHAYDTLGYDDVTTLMRISRVKVR